MKISEADILNELQAAFSGSRAIPDRPAGVYTAKEIRGAMGWSDDTARQRLGELKAAGRLEVHHIKLETLSGRMVRQPAYRILPLKSAPKSPRKSRAI